MFRDYAREEEAMKDVQELIQNIEKAKEDMTIYCQLMKEIFLSTSGKN